jgi:hydrogenase nickel incorporation protein HypA/HybF
MHELSLATNVVDFLDKLAKEQGLSRIDEVFIEIGEMTHIDPRQLRFSLKIASDGTVAEKSKFFIKKRKVVLECKKCGKESALDPKHMISEYILKCPLCGCTDVKINQGKEMLLKRVKGAKNQDMGIKD